jgi:hypothetical protein
MSFGAGGSDFSGPFGFGSVLYRQDEATGALTLRVKLRSAAPNITYKVGFSCGGASHAETACPRHFLGMLTTNKQGSGKSQRFTVPFATLQALPGSVGHIDIDTFADAGGWFVAGHSLGRMRPHAEAERRRSRTDPAWGYHTSPVLKTGWATGPVPLRGSG